MRVTEFILAILLHLAICLGACGEVVTDCLYLTPRESNYYSLCGSDQYCPSTAFRFVRKSLSISGKGGEAYVEPAWNGRVSCAFIQVAQGDRVSLSLFSSATSFFQRVHINCDGSDYIASDYSVKAASVGELVYLAFVVYSYWEDSPIAIGWVSLRVDANYISLEASAIDTDCRDLVVGESMFIVPADGGTWQDDVYVDATKTGDGWGYRWDGAWGSIQEGIRALRHQDSTIHVKPGVYGGIRLIDIPCFEPEGVNHLVIESTEGPSVTFIDGGGYAVDSIGAVTGGTWCVSCGDATTFPHVTLRGFALRNGLGGARGVKCLENCVIENCQYGLSNTFTTACTIRNVEAPLAPGAGASATIEYTPTGFQVAPALSPVPDPQSHMLLGTASLASPVWSVTTNFSDSAFMQTNRFFTIGVRREE